MKMDKYCEGRFPLTILAKIDQQEQHHHRFRRPSDPNSRPHRLGSRTARNRFSLPLKPPPPPQLHEAEHDDADDAVQKPWKQRPRKPALLPKATIKIGTGPSRNHHHATNNGEFHYGGSGGDNNNPAPKLLWLRGFVVEGFKKGFRLRETVEASIKSWVYTLYKAYS
ncbi:hypothetical protein JHK87_039991 [Glycine soja]|nr:hypothetical protein JHK87_039991 [Glycine soja]